MGRVITFISDRGIGLLNAFDEIFPGNPHLYCYKHLTFNLSKRITGTGKSYKVAKVTDLFFKVAYSSTEKEYRFNLYKLKEEAGHDIITEFINEIPLEHWCRAFFQGDRYGIMANSIAESFNNWIRYERLMPVYSFLQEVRLKIMEMTSRRRDEGKMILTELTPSMEEKLLLEMDKSRKFAVYYSAPGLYEVRNQHSYKVDLNKRECSCVKWQINCFPCPHALAALQSFPTGEVYDYIDPLFTADSYRKTYSFSIFPVDNVDEEYTDDDDNSNILPPVARRPTGRPKNKRILSSGEVVKKEITCGRCKKKGHHNKLTCTEPVNF